jgi:hypothetical protein
VERWRVTTGSLKPFVQGRGSLISGDPGGFQITATVDSDTHNPP